MDGRHHRGLTRLEATYSRQAASAMSISRTVGRSSRTRVSVASAAGHPRADSVGTNASQETTMSRTVAAMSASTFRMILQSTRS